MKLSTTADNVKGSHGLVQTKGFTIQANAHAFRMLSSGLYSDKVKAVLREIGCNAFDAHVSAGIAEKPILVKLPNNLDDQFYIQDWGPGLTHEEVMDLYTGYFQSTKQTSNDFTGAFGLGSKSPFAYVDSYSVVSVTQGKKRTYSMYLDNQGSPQVSLMTTEDADADWQSGVRVGFAVKPADYTAFHSRAAEVFRWFRTPPKILGGSPSLARPKARYTGPGFELAEEGGKAKVVMGNVCYPAELERLMKHPRWPLVAGLMGTKGVILTVPIGDVAPTASRESLDYTPDTLNGLHKAALSAALHMAEELKDQVMKMKKNGWAAMCDAKDYFKIMRDANFTGNLIDVFQELGLKPDEAKIYRDMIYETAMEVPKWVGTYSCATLNKHRVYGKTNCDVKFLLPGTLAWVDRTKETVIAYGVSKAGPSRARYAIQQGLYKQIICLTSTKTRPHHQTGIEDEARRLSRALFDMPMIELDKLPRPPAAVKAKGKKKGKNWVPTLPDTTVKGWALEPKCQTNTSADIRLRKAEPKNRLFGVTIAKGGWGNSTVEWRKMKTPFAKTDDTWEYRHLESLWRRYTELITSLNLEGRPDIPTSFVTVSTQQLKQLCLEQCGWKNIFDALKEVMSADVVHKELRDRVKGYYPAAITERDPIRYAGDSCWMSALSYLHYKNLLSPEALGALHKHKHKEALDKMVATAQKNEVKIPKIIDLTHDICQSVGSTLPDKFDLLTLADFDSRFARQHRRAQLFKGSELLELQKTNSALLEEVILFVLGEKV